MIPNQWYVLMESKQIRDRPIGVKMTQGDRPIGEYRRRREEPIEAAWQAGEG